MALQRLAVAVAQVEAADKAVLYQVVLELAVKETMVVLELRVRLGTTAAEVVVAKAALAEQRQAVSVELAEQVHLLLRFQVQAAAVALHRAQRLLALQAGLVADEALALLEFQLVDLQAAAAAADSFVEAETLAAAVAA